MRIVHGLKQFFPSMFFDQCSRGLRPYGGILFGMRRQDGRIVIARRVGHQKELMPRKVSVEDLKKGNNALSEKNEYLKYKVVYLEAFCEVIR